jgi:hypothetical protein
MIQRWMIQFASYLETEGLESSVAFYNTKEDAIKYLKQEYNYILESFKGGVIDWNEYEEEFMYDIGGYDKHAYNQRFEAHISKISFKESKEEE